MKTANEKVLNAMKRNVGKGITTRDFPVGFRLAARIKDLRDLGNDIKTTLINEHGMRHARYNLIKLGKVKK